jgi:hypothetical protein
MRRLLVLLALAVPQTPHAQRLPCLYWAHTVEDTLATLKAAGLNRVCVPPELADSWQAAGVETIATGAADLASRDPVPTPGIAHQTNLVSATRSPWLDANGWRFLRRPAGRYKYEAGPGKAALAAAEAFAYGADATLTVTEADVPALGQMLSFLRQLPPAENQRPLADFGVVDDGSQELGEVMNLLSRRNLLFEVLKAPVSRFRINVVLGSAGYARAEAADPSAFALKVRRQLTDSARTIRIYGTEVVICRLTGNAAGVRLHLLNYGGREIQGVRVRLRGSYRAVIAQVAGAGRVALESPALVGGATEFSIPRMTTYAVVDLTRIR